MFSRSRTELIASDAQQQPAAPRFAHGFCVPGIVFCSGVKRNRNNGKNEGRRDRASIEREHLYDGTKSDLWLTNLVPLFFLECISLGLERTRATKYWLQPLALCPEMVSCPPARLFFYDCGTIFKKSSTHLRRTVSKQRLRPASAVPSH